MSLVCSYLQYLLLSFLLNKKYIHYLIKSIKTSIKNFLRRDLARVTKSF